MAKTDERMEMISEAIRSQAEQQARDITKKATNYREHEISTYTESIIEEMYVITQRAVGDSKQNMLSSISQAEKEGMRALLQRRKVLTDTVFSHVRARLTEYGSTPEYKESVLNQLSELTSAYDHTATTVTLREADMDLAEKIRALLPGCTIKADTTVRLGGFILENSAARIRIDESMDDRLIRQREWFLEICHLRVH